MMKAPDSVARRAMGKMLSTTAMPTLPYAASPMPTKSLPTNNWP